MPGPRAVLDTSVLVSAVLRSDGPSARLLRAARRGAFAMVTSTAILDEAVEVLARPKIKRAIGLTLEDIALIRVGLQQFAETVPGEYLDVKMVPTDHDDNPVVAAALEGQAAYLVTLDARDLLSLKVIVRSGHRPIQLVNPTDFLSILRPSRRP